MLLCVSLVGLHALGAWRLQPCRLKQGTGHLVLCVALVLQALSVLRVR